VVPEEEIRAIQQVLQAQLPARSHPYLREGQRVRITHGPLAGVEGIFLQEKPERGVLVLSIELLQRSMAIEVDCAEVAAA
jgi:transcription antitermination factor NusG